jgi:hypothetical protein
MSKTKRAPINDKNLGDSKEKGAKNTHHSNAQTANGHSATASHTKVRIYQNTC